ncbi:MAG: hypothetical protein WC631_00765 [Candidatus Paceibacterota bacterium]|jgi:hypothetical protein
MTSQNNNYFCVTHISDELCWRAEDAYLLSNKFPIYSIADGITMTKDGKPDYEDKTAPTPPRIVANIFCDKSIKYLEKAYPNISSTDIISTFNFALDNIKKYYRGNSVKHEFGTTAAVVVKKRNTIIGGRFIDSGFALIRNKEIVFKTPEFHSWRQINEPNKKYNYMGLLDDLTEFVQVYEMEYKKDDLLILFTDGYEKHFNNEAFINIFKKSNMGEMQSEFERIDDILSKQNQNDYGTERTAVVIKLT